MTDVQAAVSRPFDGTVPDVGFVLGGRREESASGMWIDVESPGHHGLRLARVPRGDATDAERAVQVALGAWPAWRDVHFSERSKALLGFADGLDAAAAIPWKDRDEVIRLANASHYGLAAYIWTHDLDDALRTAESIDSGWVQINQGGPQSLGQTYGGYKGSGIGRENSLESAIEAFTQVKQINVKVR